MSASAFWMSSSEYSTMLEGFVNINGLRQIRAPSLCFIDVADFALGCSWRMCRESIAESCLDIVRSFWCESGRTRCREGSMRNSHKAC